MSWKRSRAKRLIVTSVLALAAGSSAYAYTANNTVATSNAGFGTGTVSSYTPSSPRFTLNLTGNPASITQITYTISPTSAQSVATKLSNAATWHNCTNSAGSVTCSPSGAVVTTTLNQLTVVAAD